MPQSKQMKGNRGNKTYMSFLRSSEKLRGSPVQPCDLMLGKVSTCPGNWPRLTHMHTVSVQSIILRECRWFYTLLAQSPAWPFFPISHLVFSKTFFMFLFSAILLSIVCFSIAQQHWGFWSFFYFLPCLQNMELYNVLHVSQVSCNGTSLARWPWDRCQRALPLFS